MHYYFTAVSLIAGICLGFGFLYLFIGLRRKENKPLNISFSLFAICYAVTLFNGTRWYTASIAAEYITINRFDTVFVTGAYVGLVWFISFYTDIRPRVFMWVLSAALILPGFVLIISPAAFLGEVSGLVYISLPWGEELANLDFAGSIWLDVLLIARLVTLGYIIFALILQFKRGEHQAAILLGLGMLPFIAGIFYEILGESGYVPFIPFGELGFLGIAIAASLQMSNSVIKTEESLEQHQHNLEGLVKDRTEALEKAQERVLSQAEEKAVTAERNRLARDLHDEVTQTIYSASLIAQVLPQIWERNPEEGQRNLVKLRQLVLGALGEMRTLLFELRPSAIENADIKTLLQQLSDAFTGRTRVPVTLTVDVEESPPPEVKVVVFRIAQEALNNINKHAKASRVELLFLSTRDKVDIKIRDNGIGFERVLIKPDNLGIHIMHERAGSIGADLKVESTPGSGSGSAVIMTWYPTEEQE